MLQLGAKSEGIEFKDMLEWLVLHGISFTQPSVITHAETGRERPYNYCFALHQQDRESFEQKFGPGGGEVNPGKGRIYHCKYPVAVTDLSQIKGTFIISDGQLVVNTYVYYRKNLSEGGRRAWTSIRGSN